MNRRDFIIKGLKLGGALLAGANISTFLNPIVNINNNVAKAADYTLYASDLPIVENYFNYPSHSSAKWLVWYRLSYVYS